MQVEQTAVLDALKVVQDPDLHRDIVSLGFIKDLKIDGGRVAFTIELTTPACPVKDQMRDQARAAVLQRARASRRVDVQMSARVREAVGGDGARQPLPGVKNIIAVGAGQGRRRQDDGRREPGDRAREVRQQGRHHRRRHLRARTCRSCSA